jgi:hypothetical protein
MRSHFNTKKWFGVVLLVSLMAVAGVVQSRARKPEPQLIQCPAHAICPDHGVLSDFSGRTKYAGGCVFGLYGHTIIDDPKRPETIHKHTFWASCGCN